MNGEIVVARSEGEVTVRRPRRIDERQVALLRETTGKTDIEQIVHLDGSEVRIDGMAP